MKEERCQNPHPKLQGRMCNSLLKAKEGVGIITMECPRCFGPVTFNFESEGTEALTVSAA